MKYKNISVIGDSNLQYGGTINIDELNALDLDEGLNKLKNSLIAYNKSGG